MPAGSIPACAGEPPRHRVGDRRPGSIPACAGEPPTSMVSHLSSRVYPRVCGGTLSRPFLKQKSQGLSPRVRGNHADQLVHDVCLGSIPACAGEPLPGECAGRGSRVYPRVCGGTAYVEYIRELAKGLSPRVRGNRRIRRCSRLAVGSVPACAGEPDSSSLCPLRRRVYPRVCGGTDLRQCAPENGQGLSPRVRGNHSTVPVPRQGRGSIPACAGEPSPACAKTDAPRVYPRVCGGTRRTREPGQAVRGLSPRVRGNLRRPVGGQHDVGSIPACAGEPGVAVRSATATRVYPRVCGGTP